MCWLPQRLLLILLLLSSSLVAAATNNTATANAPRPNFVILFVDGTSGAGALRFAA